MAAPRRYPRKIPQPLPPPKATIGQPPTERPRMTWRREDGRGDLPPDLWALMQEGGRRLSAAPSPHRAAQLLALTEHAAFKTWVPGTLPPWHGALDDPLESPGKPAEGVSGDWWGDIAAVETPCSTPVWRQDVVTQRAMEGGAAMGNLRDDPANEGEMPFEQTPSKEWWE